MKIDVKFNLCLLILSIRFLSIVDCNELVAPSNRQMCTQVRSMLSFGKYYTTQMSSNITFVSRVYAQSFLAYSSIDNVLIFIEPKHQLHVYNTPTIRLLANITTSNIVYATSCVSLTSDSLHELYFVSETRVKPKLISLRVCQVRFNRMTLEFEENMCIQTLMIPCDVSDIRINGFTIKRNHSETKKSLVFISTDIGLIYAIFDTITGSLTREPVVLNDTLNEGSVVVTSSGIVYYANKKEHTIHEIIVTRDFRIRYGKIIKSNAIKFPFGLITDECDHLYIATKSMILVMYIEKYLTIRSVFCKASDLPISIERLNATTYVYPTVKSTNKGAPVWFFNFLSFNEPEKPVNSTPKTAVRKKKRRRLKKKQIYTTDASQRLLTTTDATDTDLTSTTVMSEHASNEEQDGSYEDDGYFDTSTTDHQTSTKSIHTTIDHSEQPSSDSTLYTVPETIGSSTTGHQTSTESIHTTIDHSEQSSSASTLHTVPETMESTTQISTSTSISTTADTILNEVSDDYTIAVDTTEVSTEYIHSSISTSTSLEITSMTSSFDTTSSMVDSTTVPETTTFTFDLEGESSTIQTLTTTIEITEAPTTTTSALPTTVSTHISTIETTDSVTTSDTTEQSSTTTLSDESTSLTTTYVDETSSFTDTISSESTTTEYVTPSTAMDSTTMFDSTTISETDEPSTVLFETTTEDYIELTTTEAPLLETTSVLETTEENSTEHTSTEFPSPETTTEDNSTEYASTEPPSLETTEYMSTETSSVITSTVFPDVYTSTMEYSTMVVTSLKPPPPQLPTKKRTRTSTTTTTTNSPRKQRISRPKSSLTATTTATTTTSTSAPETTTPYPEYISTSTIYIWYPKFDTLQPQQQMIIIKPSLNSNSSSTLLSSDLLQTLFNSSSNSSDEKLIYFNLAELPPSSWNVSLHTNGSILLGIILPPPSHPITLESTTNLSITNVDANRFSTTIVGIPINLQVDQIQTKQFSLAMNLTNDKVEQSVSDVVIGHIKSEQFELNITKSDNLNIHVQQVDSETAELFFDSKFCSNESNLQINLNLSKNGSIRYGDRAPLRIGPVFTRVHMLKQSCELEQPFTLFFDICQGQNPCLNGGTCESHVPNYDDPSFSIKDSSQINYNCICPARTSGEHCQYLQYPTGYCINGGTLLSSLDSNNETIETCSCPPGFQGEHCEDNIDDCVKVQCSYHGICQDGIQTYTCSCFAGYYGSQCEQRTVETVVLQVASKSFATIAILVIASIAGLVVASDIHTYLTRKENKNRRFYKIPRTTSEAFENSILLLGFNDAPIEMSDLSTVERPRATSMPTQTIKKPKKQARYHRLTERRYTRTLERPPSKHHSLSRTSYETIM